MILSKKRILIKNYIKKISELEKKDFLIVEGAGGLLSPISRDGLNIDLINALHSIQEKEGKLYRSSLEKMENDQNTT